MDLVRRRLLVTVASTVVLVASCRSGAGRVDGRTEQQAAALTANPSASSAAREQTLADAFARQAAVYAQLAAADRAQVVAVSAAIATEQQQVAAMPAPPATAASAPADPALATSGINRANPVPTTSAGVPAAAAKFEADRQKAAALGDRLGANAQRLASFHLARVSQLTGAAGAGGAL